MKPRSPGAAVLLFLVLTLAALAKLLVCPRCGYEYQPGDAICAHCQNPLPADAGIPSTAIVPPPAAADAAAASDRMDRLTVEKELQRSEAQLAAGHPWAAQLIARNAAGGTALLPDAADLEARRRELESKATHSFPMAQKRCPVCNGTGNREQLFVSLDKTVTRQINASERCRACGGSGIWESYIDEETRLGQAAREENAVRADWAARGAVDSGGAWLPKSVADRLTLRERVAARRAVAGLCENCNGTGYEACEACDGSGKLDCSNPDCVSGQIVCPDCEGTRKVRVTEGNRTITRGCERCRQSGTITCPDCAGRSYLVCDECKGRGEVLCPTCKGKGERAICSACNGQGLRECTHCNGTGKDKNGPCKTCAGEGVKLCTTCQGTGRARR